MATFSIDDNTIVTVASIISLGAGLYISRGILKHFANFFFDLCFFVFFLLASGFLFFRLNPDNTLRPQAQALASQFSVYVLDFVEGVAEAISSR